MKFNTKDGWQEYLKGQINNYGGYAVVKHSGTTELIYFARHTYEGEHWFLESPNNLRRYKVDDEIRFSFIEHGCLIKENYAYDIDSPQTSPFLPDEIEIMEIIGSSEGKALDWLLKYEYKDYKWRN